MDRRLDRMAESETYANMQLTRTDSRAPLTAEPDVSYVQLDVTALSAPRVRRDGDGLTSTYAEVNFPKDQRVIGEDDAPPIVPGPRKLPTNAQTGTHKQQPKENIGNRSYLNICLLCPVTTILVAIVTGLLIYVSQIHQSQITSYRDYQLLWEQYQEMNRTQIQYRHQVHELKLRLESKTFENSRLNLSHGACLQNLSVLNNQLSIFERKLRTVSGNKVQICQFLTSSRVEKCSKYWFRHEERCYFFSTFETSYDEARQECSNFDSRLLEINSQVEASFVFRALASRIPVYWIGKCEEGKVASGLLYYVSSGTPVCIQCQPRGRNYPCNRDRRFICEKSTPLYPAIPENIQDLCQQPLGAS
ncbi:uncharacterized protein [Mobula birostris]|uniref:uncharacterized protein isoform X1 n=2 Tax=Mobula birostris TaxID=1983395 RepID=UPI003B28BFE4